MFLTDCSGSFLGYFVYSEYNNRKLKRESLAKVIPAPTIPRVNVSKVVYAPSVVEISEKIEEESSMNFITSDESFLGDEAIRSGVVEIVSLIMKTSFLQRR